MVPTSIAISLGFSFLGVLWVRVMETNIVPTRINKQNVWALVWVWVGGYVHVCGLDVGFHLLYLLLEYCNCVMPV